MLWKEAGYSSELDYTEQTSWLLFLKYLDGFEQDKANEAALEGKKHSFILDKPYRWETWAAPKGRDAKIDHNKAMTGDNLRNFVNGKLFPYLYGFKQKASGPNTIEYKIGEIFGEIKNKIQSGYNLREIIDHIDELRFRSQTEKHELSALYEEKIKRMGNAGRNGGEYYTPRPLIRAIVKVIKPQIGERIYDGACGSAGFLCESFEYLTGHHHEPHGASRGSVTAKTGQAPNRLICAWSVEAATIDPTTFDLSVKNLNGGEEVTHRSDHGRNRRAGRRGPIAISRMGARPGSVTQGTVASAKTAN